MSCHACDWSGELAGRQACPRCGAAGLLCASTGNTAARALDAMRVALLDERSGVSG